LARPKDEEFEVVYREKRLQPFWRIASRALSKYERTRDYSIALSPEVRKVVVDGAEKPVADHRIVVSGYESCEEETRREVLVDGLTGAETGELSAYLG